MRLPSRLLDLGPRVRAAGAFVLLLVALVAANDFLLQPPPSLDRDGLTAAQHHRGASLFAALDDDEHDHHACAPNGAGTADLPPDRPEIADAPHRSGRLSGSASSPFRRGEADAFQARGPPGAAG